MRKLLCCAALVTLVAGCSSKELNITNPNVATIDGASADPTALQLLATGLLIDQRGNRSGFITNAGVIGRESYTFTPTEGRNVTHPLIGITVGGIQKLDPTGFATGPWGGQYNALRDIFNFNKVVNGKADLTATQKSAALGYSEAFAAYALFEIVQTHDTLGGITEVKEDPLQIAAFVSRDSMYHFILNSLDDAAAKLAAGGAAFPFALTSGYAGFNTPATFRQFVFAIKAKAAAHYATAGGGTAAWNAALAALNSSFLNAAATTRAALDVGVYDTYAAAPDTPNPLNATTNTNLYAHMSFQSDAQNKADNTPDNRYLAKIRTGLAARSGPVTSAGATTGSSTLGFNIWTGVSSSIPVIRNEELILLRAEARLATADKAGAIADLNQVRINSGGLPASTLTTASTDDQVLLGILYEKRFSLMMEGVRWIDYRRYNKLNLLPLDVTTGTNKNFVAKVNPIPQGECLVRVGLAAEFQGPGSLNNCQ